MGADSQNAWQRLFQMNRQRRIASGPAKQHFATADDGGYRVIHVADDRPVMDKEVVGDSAESLSRLEFVDADRFVAQVSAGRDDRNSEISHQEMMQGRIGQHDAEAPAARRNCRREQRFTRSAMK